MGTTSEAAFRRAAINHIRKTPQLQFLLDETKNLKRTKGLSHADLANHSDLVQMGHLTSSKGGGARIVLQDAWLNQIDNITVEHPGRMGAYYEAREAVDIFGIAVERRTALLWEEEGLIPLGTVGNAAKVP